MMDPLCERKRWFGYFPEGTIEFLVITRVLALILASTLVIVPSTQRPAVLIALAGMIWLDYALLIWWLLQMGADLDTLFTDAREPRADRPLSGMIALAPSVFALLLLAPWPQFLIRREAARERILVLVIPLLIAGFLASVPFAYRCFKRAGFAGGLWLALLFVPVVHWLALHRLLAPLHARVRERALELRLPVTEETGAGPALRAADVFLIGSAPFWALWAGMLITGTTGGLWLGLVQAVSIAGGCLFAVTQVAALEQLQRRFVALIRKAEPASGPQSPDME